MWTGCEWCPPDYKQIHVDLQEGSCGLSWASTITSFDITAGRADCPTTAIAPAALSTKKLFVCCHFHPLPPLLATRPLQVAALHNPSCHPEDHLAASLHTPTDPYSHPYHSQKPHLSPWQVCKASLLLGRSAMVKFNLVPRSKEKGKLRFCLQSRGKIICPGLFFQWVMQGGRRKRVVWRLSLSCESESAIKADSAYSLDRIKKKTSKSGGGTL